MMIWGAGQSSILQWLYANVSLLAEFRFLGRALAIAALWWIVLAGMALDWLWKAARERFGTSPIFMAYSRTRLLRAMGLAALFWGYWFVYSIANPSTRQNMVLRNFRWLNSLDEHRFTSFSQAVNAFWSLLLIAVLLDTLLLILERWIRPCVAALRGVTWRAVGTRLAQIGVLLLAVAAIMDIMTVNSGLFDFQPVGPRFTGIYTDIRQSDTNPFPSINEPFGPLAFDDYENGVRSWGLNEGWRPQSSLDIIPSHNTLTGLPRWAIVSNAYGGASQDYAQKFVDYYGYTREKCYALNPAGGTDDPCLMDYQHMAAALYEKPNALPYAFAGRTALKRPRQFERG
jgi:hypothetical protein